MGREGGDLAPGVVVGEFVFGVVGGEVVEFGEGAAEDFFVGGPGFLGGGGEGAEFEAEGGVAEDGEEKLAL